MALQSQIWPQLSVRIDKVLEVIAEVGQPLDGTTLTSSTMTDTYNLSQACPPEEAEVSNPHPATYTYMSEEEGLLVSIICSVCFTYLCMYALLLDFICHK